MKRRGKESEGNKDYHVRATFTLPSPVIAALEVAWRAHINQDGSLCRNKSNYVADLIQRDAVIDTVRAKKRQKT